MAYDVAVVGGGVVDGARGWLLQTTPPPWTAGHTLMDAGWSALPAAGPHGPAPTVVELAGQPVDPARFSAPAVPTGPSGGPRGTPG
jgi:hypothetical protein